MGVKSCDTVITMARRLNPLEIHVVLIVVFVAVVVVVVVVVVVQTLFCYCFRGVHDVAEMKPE